MARSHTHVADALRETTKIVFTAQSAKNFHLRMLICKHAFEQGVTPINPFTNFGYYLYELVERDLVRQGNNNLVRIADELWVYGDISDGIISEIRYAKQLKKPIRYFDINRLPDSPAPARLQDLPFEPNIADSKDGLISELAP